MSDTRAIETGWQKAKAVRALPKQRDAEKDRDKQKRCRRLGSGDSRIRTGA